MIPFPNKKYQIIYADPPWHYKFGQSSSRYVINKYNTMTLEELKNLPVNNISQDNSVLLMWVTFPKLKWAIPVIESWGFEYKTCAFTWIKKNKKSDSLFWGMGYYTRSNAEICLLATKGNPLKRLSHSIHSIIEHSIMKHSQKPPVIRNKIIELFGDLPRIELFARVPSEILKDPTLKGWDVWGDEI